jgi:hypothetical protein
LHYHPDPPMVSVLWRSSGALRFKDPEGHTSSSVATGRISHPGQSKCDDPDETENASPPLCGLDERLITLLPLKKTVRPETFKDISDGNRKQKTIWLKGTGSSTDPRNRMLERRATNREDKRQIWGDQKGLYRHTWVAGLPPPWKTQFVLASTESVL